MPTVMLQFRSRADQTAFNLRRWDEVVEDPDWQKVPGRVETDRHGRIIMSPPPAPDHGFYQIEIGALLGAMMKRGRTMAECPISTADGVRAADVAWASAECLRELGNRKCFVRAPEICV